MSDTPETFSGGRRLMLACAVLGVLGTGLTGVGAWLKPTLAASSWLLAFTYWAGLAMASLLLVAAFNAAGAKWVTLVRRQLEHFASALVVCGAAFAGVAATAARLYPWADPALTLPAPKRAWLDVPGFIARGAIIFVLFIGVWALLDRLSRLQAAKPPDEALRAQARRVSAGALVFLALAMTTGAVDWLMSLEPSWSSGLFGLCWLTGSSVSAAALLMLAVIVPVDKSLPGVRATKEHVASLAALLLAASCAWGFVAFSQHYTLAQAKLPDEVAWLTARSGAWSPLATLLVVGRFALPCAALLSYELKRHRKFLTALGVWLLTMQFVDLFWVIKPALRLNDAALTLPEAAFAWTDVTAWVGLGGLCAAFVLFRMRGRHAIPANDPALEYSLQYGQPS